MLICGFARSYMSRIERGTSNASLDAIETLARALGVEAWQLFASNQTENTEIVIVPYAKDGTCFNPGLASNRDRSYVVGEADNLKRFLIFEEALDYLRKMETAKWKRPNANGNWGIVSAVRWDSLEK